ncbi:MAG: hypothetical protein EA357_05465 [Micavibrio sp.]|nr:MAG: hypothetical protein EA357_05465 [Micavibrio sp.]
MLPAAVFAVVCGGKPVQDYRCFVRLAAEDLKRACIDGKENVFRKRRLLSGTGSDALLFGQECVETVLFEF